MVLDQVTLTIINVWLESNNINDHDTCLVESKFYGWSGITLDFLKYVKNINSIPNHTKTFTCGVTFVESFHG